jgi:hypothetical protein
MEAWIEVFHDTAAEIGRYLRSVLKIQLPGLESSLRDNWKIIRFGNTGEGN